MRIVFLGSGAFAVPTLRWLSESEHEVALVVTQPARPSGRGRRTTLTPVGALADDLGLKSLEAEDVNAPQIAHRLLELEVRIGLVIAFGQKLDTKLLSLLRCGFINLHASLLPNYRGAAPINRAIVCGEQRTGCTVFRLTERMDAGPILTSRWTNINLEETAGELHDRLSAIGVDAMQAALGLYEGGEVPNGTPQNEEEATFAAKLTKKDGYVRFDLPAADVVNHICGMTPWPGAATRFQAGDGRWEKVNITRARVAEDPSTPSSSPGTIDERRYAAALDGFVEIIEIQPSSGRIMSWADYVNGRHIKSGDEFVTPGK